MQITKIITDETLRELRDHGTEEFPFQYNNEDIQKYDDQKIEWHWHKEFEFVKVMQGEVFFLIGSQQIRLEEGEGMFVNSRVIHSIKNCNAGITSNFLFSSDLIAVEKSVIYENYVREIVESDGSHIVLKKDVEWQRIVLAKMDSIFAICRKPMPFDELDMHIRICDIWGLISKHKNELVRMQKQVNSIRTQSRLRKMLSFIGDNYFEKIYLEDIARAANISKSEAIRCFQMEMQISPIEYLNQYRLHRAKIELETTEDSIMDIAINTGFINSSYFTRIFKYTYGVTPRESRRNRSCRV